MPVVSVVRPPRRAMSRGRERRSDRERAGHREERQAGLDRREAQDLLQVEREEEPQREHRGAHEADDDVGAGQGPRAQDRQRHERLPAAQRCSIVRNRRSRAMPAPIPARTCGDPKPYRSMFTMPSTSATWPAVSVTAPATSKWRVASVPAALDDVPPRDGDEHGADRHVDKQDPAPARAPPSAARRTSPQPTLRPRRRRPRGRARGCAPAPRQRSS